MRNTNNLRVYARRARTDNGNSEAATHTGRRLYKYRISINVVAEIEKQNEIRARTTFYYSSTIQQ